LGLSGHCGARKGLFLFDRDRESRQFLPALRPAAAPCFAAQIRDLTQQEEAEREITRQRDRLYQSEKMTALGSLSLENRAGSVVSAEERC
jgi:hypothetical protein